MSTPTITDAELAFIRDYYATTGADTGIEVLSPEGCLKVAAMASELLSFRATAKTAAMAQPEPNHPA
jgi:hypothetical protein